MFLAVGVGRLEIEVAPFGDVFAAGDGDSNGILGDGVMRGADEPALQVLVRILRRLLDLRLLLLLLGCGGFAETRFLKFFVDGENKCLDVLNLVRTVVTDVRYPVHKKDDVGHILDRRDGVFGFLHHLHVPVHTDHPELTPIHNLGQLLEHRQRLVTELALLAVKHNQGQSLPSVQAQHVPFLARSHHEIIIPQK